MGFIYKIINDINTKVYIGKTEYADPKKRWKEHLKDYKKKKCKNRPLYNAMNKYGEEHFSFEIIEETYDPEETCEREQYWINELRTYVGFKDCNGYNATLGGDGKVYLNLDEDEVIKKYFELRSAKKVAKYYNVDLKTISNILHRNNIQIGLLPFPVLKIDQISCEIIERFEYINELKLAMNTDRINDNMLTSTCKPICGYLWIYEKDYLRLGLDGIRKIKEKSKYYSSQYDNSYKKRKVVCINDEMIFKSITDGKDYYNIKSTGGISECCSGKRRSCGTHPITGEHLIWMYYEDYINLSKKSLEMVKHNEIKNKMNKGNLISKCKKVICLTTMKVFEKINDASDYYKVDHSSISACCKNKLKMAGKLPDGTKLKWMYYEDYLNLHT